MKRSTQRSIVLQLLREEPDKFIPVWWFMGEKHSKALGWVLLSHKAPTRLSELYQEGLVERKSLVTDDSLDVVDTITGVQTGTSGFHSDVPEEDVIIEKVTID